MLFMSVGAVLRELRDIKERVERVEKLLETLIDMLAGGELSDEDLKALKIALEEYRRGETISLEKAVKELGK